MNNKVNYTAVGLAVLVGIILMLGFIYWMLKPSTEDEVKKYIIHFNESVLGLNVDSAVKYRGISVGKVIRLRINPKNIEQVEVLVSILKLTPVKETTVATLTSQGITGLSYINLSLGNNAAASLEAKKGEEYPVIKTEASFFERFEESLGTVSTKLSKTLTGAEELLNDENQVQISILLNRTAAFMTQMEKLANDEVIEDIHTSFKNLDRVTKKIDLMMPKVDHFIDKSVAWENDISKSLASISSSYKIIQASMDEIKRAVSDGEFNIKEIVGDVIPTINNTLIETQHLMIRVEGTLNQYERSPGDILFKQEEIKKGPGEE
ncbi:MlaD family protein [Sulfurimonas sp. CS5]|jgi:phospholipid/cholesterol/gamma-HCH transport system substrate-binding protein|uniref:MlaD family protein n=1 Tax=Sulfurimonas sp. CS5 TaxID=3391145 RepID=UPI0039EA7ABF